MNPPFYSLVAQATVTLPKKQGQGVLVDGNLILTAAHCIDFTCEGAMTLGDYFVEEVHSGGEVMRVAPLAIEPLVDLAVLGTLPTQEFPDEADRFEQYCSRTPAVPLCRVDDFGTDLNFEVHAYTHYGTWVSGSAEIFEPDGNPKLDFAMAGVDGGSSGGPIVTNSGELVGIVSNTGESDDEELPEYVSAAYPYLALPAWVLRQIGGNSR